MCWIVDVHFPDIKKRLVEEALRIFFEVREVPGLKKKPSTLELLDWLKLLLNEDITPEMLRERDPRKLIPPLQPAKCRKTARRVEKIGGIARGIKRAGLQARINALMTNEFTHEGIFRVGRSAYFVP